MVIIDSVLGNSSDPEWAKRLSAAFVDVLEVDQWEVQKSRFRKTTAKGAELAIALDRGTYIRDGDVLFWDAQTAQAIVARIDLRDVMVVYLDDLSRLAPEIAMRTGVELGHAMGNQHWPALVKGNLVYVLLTVDRKVMASFMNTHHFEGIRYDFMGGREVVPCLAPNEFRRLFGGAEGPAHQYTRETYAGVNLEMGDTYSRHEAAPLRIPDLVTIHTCRPVTSPQMSLDDQNDLTELESRIRTILPAEYQDRYEDVKPVSMGSAGLRFGRDGKVAWDEIWGSFCDLAMAGGPPHKGTLLEPGSAEQIEASSERYLGVAEEICRGIFMITELVARCSKVPGWIRVDCATQTMAEWLTRAIVMENVSARYEGTTIELPAGPGYRIEKEIKNVITAIAKTSHYWLEHMLPDQHREIGRLFLKMSKESPLVQPAFMGYDFEAEAHRALSAKMIGAIRRETGLQCSDIEYAGWCGVECSSVRAAIWMMRAMVASNVLARRQGTTLFVPVNPRVDPDGGIVAQRLHRVHRFATVRNVF